MTTPYHIRLRRSSSLTYTDDANVGGEFAVGVVAAVDHSNTSEGEHLSITCTEHLRLPSPVSMGIGETDA
jgi:hypothetical protein